MIDLFLAALVGLYIGVGVAAGVVARATLRLSQSILFGVVWPVPVALYLIEYIRGR